jgi:hypothetical protein
MAPPSRRSFIAGKCAVIDGQGASVTDGAALFCAIAAEGGVDDSQGAAWAVVYGATEADRTISFAGTIPADDAVDDCQVGKQL